MTRLVDSCDTRYGPFALNKLRGALGGNISIGLKQL